MDRYWETHPRLRENEHLCYAALGNKRMLPCEFDEALIELDEATRRSANEPKVSSVPRPKFSGKVLAALNED